MAKFTVNVPEFTGSHRRYNINEFLVEFAENDPADDRKRLFRFREPVCVIVATPENRVSGHLYALSTELFRALQEYVAGGSVIVELGARTWSLSYKAVYELNRALYTPALRKGGLNIVRKWLDTRKGYRTPLRGDFDALLAYLEIRPIRTVSPAVLPANAAAIAQDISKSLSTLTVR